MVITQLPFQINLYTGDKTRPYEPQDAYLVPENLDYIVTVLKPLMPGEYQGTQGLFKFLSDSSILFSFGLPYSLVKLSMEEITCLAQIAPPGSGSCRFNADGSLNTANPEALSYAPHGNHAPDPGLNAKLRDDSRIFNALREYAKAADIPGGVVPVPEMGYYTIKDVIGHLLRTRDESPAVKSGDIDQLSSARDDSIQVVARDYNHRSNLAITRALCGRYWTNSTKKDGWYNR
jgi:hypothetical protein